MNATNTPHCIQRGKGYRTRPACTMTRAPCPAAHVTAVRPRARERGKHLQGSLVPMLKIDLRLGGEHKLKIRRLPRAVPAAGVRSPASTGYLGDPLFAALDDTVAALALRLLPSTDAIGAAHFLELASSRPSLYGRSAHYRSDETAAKRPPLS